VTGFVFEVRSRGVQKPLLDCLVGLLCMRSGGSETLRFSGRFDARIARRINSEAPNVLIRIIAENAAFMPMQCLAPT
jgi:hypothetical protein